MAGKPDQPEPMQSHEAPKGDAPHPSPPTTFDIVSQHGAGDFRSGLAAMTPKSSDSATKTTPELVIDSSTAQALLKIDSSKVEAKIPSGGGPFQALRPNFTAAEISDQDLSKASAVIRDHRMAGHNIKSGETVPTGQAFSSDDFFALNRAELRHELHLPFNASDHQVDARMAADNAASLRKDLHMPANATDAQIDARMSADNAASLRKDLHMPANATDAQVDARMSADNAASLRQSLHMPANATDAQVETRMAADNAASLRQSLGLSLTASDSDVDAAMNKKYHLDK